MKDATEIPANGEGVPPEHRKWWAAGGGVILVVLLIWAFAGGKEETETVYTDGVGVEQAAKDAKLFNVVWDEPIPVYPQAHGVEDVYDPTISADGLTMILVKGLPKEHPVGEGTGADLYTAFLKDGVWSKPLPLSSINTKDNELGPALSSDGTKLFFYSDRQGGQGGHDIWVALRQDDGNWGDPVNLGPSVNTRYDELDPAVQSSNTANPGEPPRYQLDRLYFASSRPRGDPPPEDRWSGGTARAPADPRSDFDLFAAEITAADEDTPVDVAFGDAWRLASLNTSHEDAQPAVTLRGDFLYFASNRRGGQGGFDVYRSRIVDGEFREPENLNLPVNTSALETDPALAMEGHRLFFSSDRSSDTGVHQLYYSTWREVYPAEVSIVPDTPATPPPGFYSFLNNYKWWILLLLLTLMALLWLLRNFLSEAQQRNLSIMQKCLLASTAVHVLLAFLLSLWMITEAIYKEVQEQYVEISLDDGTLAAQKEEEALRKPVQANLVKASAAMPTPQQQNERPAAQANPVQPQQDVQPEAVQPDVSAIEPPELTLPEQLPQDAQLPKLPNQIPDPAAPQMRQPDLETAMARPVENQQLESVQHEVQVRPAKSSQAVTQPKANPVQPPTPAPANAASSATASQLAKTEVDPTQLPLAEAVLPQMEQPVNEPIQLETAETSPEFKAKPDAASRTAQVNPAQSRPNAAKPVTPDNSTPAPTPIQAPFAAAKTQPTDNPDQARTLEAAKPEVPAAQANMPVDDFNLETARSSAATQAQKAKASSQANIQPINVTATADKPIPAESQPISVQQAPATTAAAKSQPTQTAAKPATLDKARPTELSSENQSLRAQNFNLEQSDKTAEATSRPAKAASEQAVKQAAAAKPAAPQTAKISDTAIEPTEATTTAKKSQVEATIEPGRELETAKTEAALQPLALADPESVPLEGSEKIIVDNSQKAAVSSEQSIPQIAAAQDAAAPMTTTQTIEAIAAAKERSAVAKSQLSKTTDEVAKIKAAQAAINLPRTEDFDPEQVPLEQADTAVEAKAAVAKATSQQAVKPTPSKTDSTAPTPAQVDSQIATRRDLNTLMTTNTPPVAKVGNNPANLNASRANPSLPNIAALLAVDIDLETDENTPETGARPEKLSADTRLTARNAQPSRSEPIINGQTPVETAPAANKTVAQPNAPSASRAAETELKTARAASNLIQLEISNPGNIILETDNSQATQGISLSPAPRDQAVNPAAQANVPVPQDATLPAPSIADNNPASVKPGISHKPSVIDSPTTAVRDFNRFEATNQPVEPIELPDIDFVPGGNRIVAGEKGETLKPVSSQTGANKQPANQVRFGTPMETKAEIEDTPQLVGEIEMPEANAQPAVGVTVRPFELATDSAARLQLPDINILDRAPRLESPMKIDDPFVARHDPKQRLEIIDRLGGSKETEAAILRSLDWFTANQKPDGHWDGPTGTGRDRFTGNQRADHDLAATGMAMLAYMGWGAKHTEPGPYQKPLAKAVFWMARRVDESGDMRPFKGANYMYDQGIAAIAMTEAYSLTKDPRLRPHVERIVDFIVRAQSPIRRIGNRTYGGGWRYRPNGEQGYSDRGDMSVTGWQIMALKSARLGGIDVPEEVFDKAKIFMDSIATGKSKGAYGYTTTKDVKPAMIAEAMFCQQLVGLPPSHPRMQESAKLLLRNMPRTNKFNYYYWYYACLALHQHQGPSWKAWNQRMRPIFLKEQIHRPSDRKVHGSWNPKGEWAGGSGRCIITAMATLSLEVYYRYLPLYTPTWTEDNE